MNGFRVIPFCILQLFCLCSIVAFCILSFGFCNFVASVPCEIPFLCVLLHDFLLLFFSSLCCTLWLNIFFLLYDFLFCIPILQICCLDPMITSLYISQSLSNLMCLDCIISVIYSVKLGQGCPSGEWTWGHVIIKKGGHFGKWNRPKMNLDEIVEEKFIRDLVKRKLSYH